MSRRFQNKGSRAQLPSQDAVPDWKVIITTATEINVWDGIQDKYDTVFTSGTEGIVTARLAKEGNVLAVAGSQVVLLHRIEKGQQQSYKLKGSDATRLLEYTADGKGIFLNSSLRNSIQTYNVRDDKIAETLKPHPSPVSCFATSFDSTLVLSSSSNPPTIHLDNLSLRTTTHLKPQASDQKVVLASFHPTRKGIFLVSFADGVLAAFDYSKASKTGQHIHAFGHLHDAMMGGNGLTAAEFIPGSQTKAVTVGEDGKCNILDFDKKVVVGSFRIGAPATCLALRGEDVKKGGKWLAAVGTLHGWCYIYDQDGNRLHEAQVDREGSKVLEIKWKLGDIKLPATATKPTIMPQRPTRKVSSSLPVPSGRTPQQQRFRQMLPTAQEEPILAAEKPEAPIHFPSSPVSHRPPPNANKPLPEVPQKPEEDSWEDVEEPYQEQKPAWEELQNNYTADYMSIFSPVKNEPIRNSPRRSARLSVRSAQSPDKEQADKIEKLIKKDEEGLLRPSVSSPSLATAQTRSPRKKTAAVENQEPRRVMTEMGKVKSTKKEETRRELELEPEQEQVLSPTRAAPAPPQEATDTTDPKPVVPMKDQLQSERPRRRDFAPPSAPPIGPPLPSADNSAVEDFRKVRAKIESGHGHPVLSLFSSHLPNHKSKHGAGAPESVEGKENSQSSKADAKAERRRVKMEEKERKKEEKKRKKDGSFPPVSDLVFEKGDMDLDDGPPQLDLPSISPRLTSAKRKAADDPYEIAAFGRGHGQRLVSKGKGKEKTPMPEDDPWIPDEVRKPPKRLNVGLGSPPNLRSGGISREHAMSTATTAHDGTMSIHDMIADLKNRFKEEMTALKAEMKDRFQQQDQFLEGIIKSERGEVKFLRDENERLRAEIRELTGK